MNKLLSLLILTLFLIGCGDNKSTSTTETVLPGKIAMANTGITLSKKPAISEADSNTDIPLGIVKQTSQYFFQIKNVGGAAIDSLEITTSGNAFAMTPGYIPVLETDGNSTLNQIIELDVIHGTSVFGNQPIEKLLPYGRNEFTVFFDGVSLGEPFHAEFTFSVNAIYIDLVLIENDSNGVNQNLVGLEPSFEEESCNSYHSGNKILTGDTLIYAYDFTKWETDCIIRQTLPEELR